MSLYSIFFSFQAKKDSFLKREEQRKFIVRYINVKKVDQVKTYTVDLGYHEINDQGLNFVITKVSLETRSTKTPHFASLYPISIFFLSFCLLM